MQYKHWVLLNGIITWDSVCGTLLLSCSQYSCTIRCFLHSFPLLFYYHPWGPHGLFFVLFLALCWLTLNSSHWFVSFLMQLHVTIRADTWIVELFYFVWSTELVFWFLRAPSSFLRVPPPFHCFSAVVICYSGFNICLCCHITIKADSHIASCAHAVPLPWRAAKCLEYVFPIWFTQCGRVWFTLAIPCPCPCHAPTTPFFSRPQHGRLSTAVLWPWEERHVRSMA